uniref:Uncharacterized protein n=1 Tax=Arundo donax TaxID=35708 RepID=A0A0A8YX94_ARUDO
MQSDCHSKPTTFMKTLISNQEKRKEVACAM